jgi:hypothetical protein
VTDPILDSPVPFVWPALRVTQGDARYASELPFESVIEHAIAVFGVVSAFDRKVIDWLEGLLADHSAVKLRIVFSIHPTCRTTESDLEEATRLTERHGARVAFRMYPERSLTDRGSNLICFNHADGKLFIATGPSDNLGFGRRSGSHANLVLTPDTSTFESCRKWFGGLWQISGDLRPEVVRLMPKLVVPLGDPEAAALWEDFRNRCLEKGTAENKVVKEVVDPETGEVTLVDGDGKELASPTDDIGAPKVDHFAERIVRLFDLGMLVTIDKRTRLPPLEAPIKAEWFDLQSFQQTGVVSTRMSVKIAPFDDETLRAINKLMSAASDLLPEYSYSIAKGIRWIPKAAIPLFEAALESANNRAKIKLGDVVGENIDAFLLTQRDRIQTDAQKMYRRYHPDRTLPEETVSDILDELRRRLGPTVGERLIPTVSYASVVFNPHQSTEWGSQWAQALNLLESIIRLPRETTPKLTPAKSVLPVRSELSVAMDVLGDPIFTEYGTKNGLIRASRELQCLDYLLEIDEADDRATCEAIWTLMATGSCEKARDVTNSSIL